MCGIVGVVGSGDVSPSLDKIVGGMLDKIIHRGPDDYGIFINNDMGIGMRRLSIIDVAHGHQPIFNEDASLCIVFNGEIYNFAELKKDLISKGHQFKTNTDTEVIIHLYEEVGSDCVTYLRGMFAFAIMDIKANKIFITRDRLGIKPLYYYNNNGTLLFSSELKSILTSGLYTSKIDFAGLDYYFTLGYIPSPYTIFSGIKKLEPGCSITFEHGKLTKERYWDIDIISEQNMDQNEAVEEFIRKFRDSVNLHLMSEVPLGAFLSSGIDSSLIVALMAELSSNKIKTFTMGFGGNVGNYNDERENARIISDYYQTDHIELESQPDLTEILDSLVTTFDEPLADDSIIPSYYLCKEASTDVKVALTGLGGDELFGGYERYLGLKLDGVNKYIPYSLRKYLLNPITSQFKELPGGDYRINHIKRFVRNSLLPENQRYLGYMMINNHAQKELLYQEHLKQKLKNSSVEEELMYIYASHNGDYLEKASYMDLKTYLPEDILALTDRLSMKHSLELRVPFVDHEIVEYCARIPSKLKIKGVNKKYLLKKTAQSYLPDKILKMRKQGFAAPMTSWLKTELKDFVKDRLSTDSLSKHNFFNPEFIHYKIDEHQAGREINDKFIFSLLIFQAWYEKHLN